MITEIAQIEVKPGMEAEFESGVKNAAPIFKRAKGCRGMELHRSAEKPNRYRLFVNWETMENHTVDFRDSADFQEWRKLVSHCFASPPEVEHVDAGGAAGFEPAGAVLVAALAAAGAHNGCPYECMRPSPLHIRDTRRHAEFAAADFRERGDAGADRLMRGIGEAQPGAAFAVGLVGRPFRAGIDGDAGGKRRLEELQGIDLVGQLDPQENAALRIVEFGCGAELLVKRVHQSFELFAQAAREFRHVGVEMRGAKFAEHHLFERAGAGVGLERQHAREQRPIRRRCSRRATPARSIWRMSRYG